MVLPASMCFVRRVSLNLLTYSAVFFKTLIAPNGSSYYCAGMTTLKPAEVFPLRCRSLGISQRRFGLVFSLHLLW